MRIVRQGCTGRVGHSALRQTRSRTAGTFVKCAAVTMSVYNMLRRQAPSRRIARPAEGAETGYGCTPLNGGNMHRLRVTFTGFDAFFPRVLADGLAARHADEIDSRWILWPSSALQRLAFAREALRTDVMVRVGMPFEFQSETNRWWLAFVRAGGLTGVNYWIGTDVERYIGHVHSDGASRRELRAAKKLRHLATHENLSKELASIGIDAVTATIPSPEYHVPTPLPPMPAEFRVFSYIPDGPRFQAYGGPTLMSVADSLPDVRFDIVGGEGLAAGCPTPSNVHFHGWVDNMVEFFATTSVVVRMVAHDAVPGGTVEEGLVFGRHVVYSFEWPDTRFVAFGDAEGLRDALSDMRALHDTGALGINTSGHDAMVALWDHDVRYRVLRDTLFDFARKG